MKGVNGLSQYTIVNQSGILKKFDEYLKGKTFKEATEGDLFGFVNGLKGMHGEAKRGTKKANIIVLKSFYRFLYGTKPGEYPQQVTNLNGNGNGKRELPIRPEDVLNDEDIAKLVKGCTNFRDEAVVVTLYESGCRLGDFLGMNVGHLL